MKYRDLVYDKLHGIKWIKIKKAEHFGTGVQRLVEQRADRIAEFYKYFYDRVHIVPDGYFRNLTTGPVVFEGNQGVLIDEKHGFEPYHTWTDCTFGNADKMLEPYGIPSTKIGVLRTYFTRHGAGPFPSEDNTTWFTTDRFSEHNGHNQWQGDFRYGKFDLVLARYARKCVGELDGLAITHIDQIENGVIEAVNSYKMNGQIITDIGDYHPTESLMRATPHSFVEMEYQELAGALGAPIMIESRGPTAEKKEIKCLTKELSNRAS